MFIFQIFAKLFSKYLISDFILCAFLIFKATLSLVNHNIDYKLIHPPGLAKLRLFYFFIWNYYRHYLII